MSPGHWHPSYCYVCGVTVEEVGHISQTGLCREHWMERAETNLDQLMAHKGPYFDHWRRRCLAAFGVTVDSD